MPAFEERPRDRKVEIVRRCDDDEVDAVFHLRFLGGHSLVGIVGPVEMPGLGARFRFLRIGRHGAGNYPRLVVEFGGDSMNGADESALPAADDTRPELPHER